MLLNRGFLKFLFFKKISPFPLLHYVVFNMLLIATVYFTIVNTYVNLETIQKIIMSKISLIAQSL